MIVDPSFGGRIREIPAGEPIWIVDTACNRLAYEAVRKERTQENHLVGLTSFKVDPAAHPEDWLISELETIDLHHGELSHDTPWSLINVLGVKWTERIGEELARYGFSNHQETLEGFLATKELANNGVQVTLASSRT